MASAFDVSDVVNITQDKIEDGEEIVDNILIDPLREKSQVFLIDFELS